jgi:hypothetical protein
MITLMRKSPWIVTCIAALTVVAVAGAARTAFTPKSIAGTWSGTWKNETFGSTGPASIKAAALAGNTKLAFTADFGGNMFGCADPAGETAKPLTKGAGANHWSAGGFVIQKKSKALGSLKLTYTAANGKLVGNGSNPPCASGLSWKATGKFAGKTFTAKINITLPDKTTATSTISLTKS